MTDDLEQELAVPAAPAAVAPAPAAVEAAPVLEPAAPPAPIVAGPPAAVAPVLTTVAVDHAARESAVQAAIASVKAEAAVAQLDVEPAKTPEPVALPAPVVAAPCGAEEAEPEPELNPMQRLEACERHIEELIRHLAQSFGGEFAAKKERMGV